MSLNNFYKINHLNKQLPPGQEPSPTVDEEGLTVSEVGKEGVAPTIEGGPMATTVPERDRPLNMVEMEENKSKGKAEDQCTM